MKINESALFSRYVIDGIRHDATPYELLSECMNPTGNGDGHIVEEYADIVDESTDPPVTSFTYRSQDNEKYFRQVSDHDRERPFRLLYPETFTKQRVAKALIDRIWNKGHFKLCDLRLWAEWIWNSRPLGNMAAFHSSVQAASEYIYDLGCILADFSYDGCDEESSLRIEAWLSEDEDGLYESCQPWIEDDRLCPDIMTADRKSNIIYIPFETASYKLGGSLLAEVNGHNGGPGLRLHDPDYFIDCYEVVRELIEDGIVISGRTVSDGGLGKALDGLCGENGIEINLRGIMSSYMEEDTTKVLFSEIPGLVLQIDDTDMDYLDSQLILQDVAYYPLGSPTSEFKGIRFNNTSEATVAGILASLINIASEGED